MIRTVKVIAYGTEVTQQPTLDEARRDLCLCWHCTKLKPDEPENNCVIAQRLYEICWRHNVAVGVSRCAEFEKKGE